MSRRFVKITEDEYATTDRRFFVVRHLFGWLAADVSERPHKEKRVGTLREGMAWALRQQIRMRHKQGASR